MQEKTLSILINFQRMIHQVKKLKTKMKNPINLKIFQDKNYLILQIFKMYKEIKYREQINIKIKQRIH